MAQNKHLKSRLIQGFGTLIFREFFIKLFSFVGQLILARILIPSEFGIYAIIVFIVTLFGLFSDIGLSLAIIQKKEEPTKNELSSIFWLKIFLSLGLILLVLILAPFAKSLIPSFTDSNVLMLQIFSVTLLLTNLRSLPIALLERKIDYNLISKIDIIGIVVYYIVAICGAALNLSVWSFVLGSIIKEIVETLIFYFKEPFYPHFKFSINKIRKLIRFGAYVQGNNLISFFIPAIIPVVGGRVSGANAVGLLDLAYTLSSIPAIISMNFARVAFTGFSRIQDEKEKVSRAIEKSVSMLAILLYIFPVLILSFGGEIIHFLYSEKWSDVTPALAWFSAAVFFYPTLTSLGQVILAIGKSKMLFWFSTTATIFGWSFAAFFSKTFNFTWIAIAYFFIYCILFISYVYILKNAKYNFSIFSVIMRQLMVSLATILLCLFFNSLLPQNFIMLIFKILICIVIYLLLLLIIVRAETKELFSMMIGIFQKKEKVL